MTDEQKRKLESKADEWRLNNVSFTPDGPDYEEAYMAGAQAAFEIASAEREAEVTSLRHEVAELKNQFNYLSIEHQVTKATWNTEMNSKVAEAVLAERERCAKKLQERFDYACKSGETAEIKAALFAAKAVILNPSEDEK